MAPHKPKESTVPELSETENMSTTESIASDTTPNVYQEMSLDNLFNQLKQEHQNSNDQANQQDEPIDEFTKLKTRVENLPKIQGELKPNDSNMTKSANSDIVKIHDPIVIKAKKSKDEPEDSGSQWFHMKQPEMTDSIKRDIAIIKQRSALDPKRHYKKEKWNTPKYFQMGTIIEGNTEYYSSRMNKRDRGKTLADEILHDNDSQKYFKRKYTEIQAQKTSGGKKHYKNIKNMRKKY